MNSESREIELLAPARTADIGIEAINCGADAVYIGAEAFGARRAAPNSVADIARLANYAHRYGAKVYVALNTILYDNELDKARHLIDRLAAAGVDALIVQDTALLTMELPLPLHASTQMDIRTAEKVQQLRDWGFEQAVLARELGIREMAEIHRSCPEMKLEAFVHGALCVSYSGRCYASQYCFGRSANRGECAQFCRLAFDLQDGEGRTLVENKHLLSLKDMNRSLSVEQMLDAGISSLKIEGRLKDMAYVKNTTAYYSRLLDRIVNRRPQHYRRSSRGECHIAFEPDLQKTFNRGFTDYFLRGRTDDVASIHTPKAVGEPVGKVKEIRNGYILVSGTGSFHNGDGICYFGPDGSLQGFRVNRADDNRLYPHMMPAGLSAGTPLFRNHNTAFEQAVLRPSQPRTLALRIRIEDTDEGFRLTATDEMGRKTSHTVSAEHQLALKPQTDRIVAELSRTGGTGYEVTEVETVFSQDLFIPASLLSQWRRDLIGELQKCEIKETPSSHARVESTKYKPQNFAFTENIANSLAQQFYKSHGAQQTAPAFEIAEPEGPAALMTCKHCIKYSLGLCVNKVNKSKKMDLYLVLPDGRRFPLEFDCRRCEMRVMKEK